ncbi:MAG: response regulator [Acidobacteriota bacterium]
MEKILVIDDERPTLDMMSLTLDAYGYDVLTAENGREGLDVFERERPSLVLTDIKMPGMDGIEVLKRIKAIAPNTEVIVITGHGDMDLAIKALNLDATDFINKPVQRQALENALKRARDRLDLLESKERQISVEVGDEAAVIHIRGSVNSQSEAHLQGACREAFSKKGRTVMRFDSNASINGAGMAILTQLLLDARKEGHRVAIEGLSDNFRRIFKIVGIASLVDLTDDDEDS